MLEERFAQGNGQQREEDDRERGKPERPSQGFAQQTAERRGVALGDGAREQGKGGERGSDAKQPDGYKNDVLRVGDVSDGARTRRGREMRIYKQRYRESPLSDHAWKHEQRDLGKRVALEQPGMRTPFPAQIGQARKSLCICFPVLESSFQGTRA